MSRSGRFMYAAVIAATLALLGACGGDGEGAGNLVEPEATGSPETSSASETTMASRGDPASDLPKAPDFTLELGGGGTFTLSEQTTPVLILFWAEW